MVLQYQYRINQVTNFQFSRLHGGEVKNSTSEIIHGLLSSEDWEREGVWRYYRLPVFADLTRQLGERGYLEKLVM